MKTPLKVMANISVPEIACGASAADAIYKEVRQKIRSVTVKSGKFYSDAAVFVK